MTSPIVVVGLWRHAQFAGLSHCTQAGVYTLFARSYITQRAAMVSVAGYVDEILNNLVSEVEAYVNHSAAQSMQNAVHGEKPPEMQHDLVSSNSGDAAQAPGIFSKGASSEQEPLRKGSSAASERTASDDPGGLAAAESQPLGSEAATTGAAELQQQLSQPQHDTTSSQLLITPPDAPGLVAKSNKLLALKQRRLGSLSSSLDLSRESSFDVSALHTGLHDAVSSQQNWLAPSSSHEQLLLQNESVLNEQASTSLACLPLDSSTGTIVPMPRNLFTTPSRGQLDVIHIHHANLCQ